MAVDPKLANALRANGISVGPSVAGRTLRGPASVLGDARVDLVDLASRPPQPRESVPGADGIFLRGKRHLWVAKAGVGKSLAALVAGVQIVEAGGRVAFIDVENGRDEYARRLRDVLGPRGQHAHTACSHSLHYYEYPALRRDWPSESWVRALADRDLVVFDSSRLVCSALGLAEDRSDDYGEFADAMLMPLSRAGVATLVLDNTGHGEQGRARGTSAKEDLNEVMFALAVHRGFDARRTGAITFTRKRTRFGDDIKAEFTMTVGGGAYDISATTSDGGIRNRMSDAAAEILRAGDHTSASAALGADKLIEALRKRGETMRSKDARARLLQLAEKPDNGIEYQHGRGYFVAVPSSGRSTSVPVPGRTGTDDRPAERETTDAIVDSAAVPPPGTDPDGAHRPPGPPLQGDGDEVEEPTRAVGRRWGP